MTTIARTLYILLICVVTGLGACKHDDKETAYLGNKTRAATSDLVVGDICLASIDPISGVGMTCNPTYRPAFGANYNCYFVCDFNKEVTWTITITGRTSGAVKAIHGTTASLPFGNTESIWKGTADGYRFFLKNEICDVSLTFLGSTIERHTTVQIRNVLVASPYGNVYGERAVIDNLDIAGSSSLTYSYVDLDDGGNNSIYLCRANSEVTPIDGYFMLRLKGHDGNANTYLGGTGPELLTSHVSQVRTAIPSGETDASKLYFNMYVYGTGLPNTNLQIRAYEYDALSNSASAGDPLPTYRAEDEKVNDQWAYNLYINWTGWKLVSIPYSAFKPSDNPAKGGNGNRFREPRKITSFNLLLQSLPDPGATVDTYVDYMVITWGQPFHQ